jgi:hypothetical protein
MSNSKRITNGSPVERCRALGLGYCRRQLCHLPQPHHGPLHRLPGQPSVGDIRRVHRCLGYLQCRFRSFTTIHLSSQANTEYSSMPSTSTASLAGSRRVRSARSTIATGSSRSTVARKSNVEHRDIYVEFGINRLLCERDMALCMHDGRSFLLSETRSRTSDEEQ